jgi:hypothetical protein
MYYYTTDLRGCVVYAYYDQMSTQGFESFLGLRRQAAGSAGQQKPRNVAVFLSLTGKKALHLITAVENQPNPTGPTEPTNIHENQKGPHYRSSRGL